MNISVFASGGGSNFQVLLDKQGSGELPVHFVACIGNNSKAQAFSRAKEHHIPTHHIAPTHFDSQGLYIKTLLTILKEADTELIILAGYMKKLPLAIIQAYPNKIINIHPALLPAFGGHGMYGMNVHNAVIAYGAKLSGITVHFVDEEYDHGAIITQKAVPVLSNYSAQELAQAVLQKEHETLWLVVKALAEKKLRIQEGKVYGDL